MTEDFSAYTDVKEDALQLVDSIISSNLNEVMIFENDN
jgi:hypothetical protein